MDLAQAARAATPDAVGQVPVASSSRRRARMLGTPAYMAPEQFAVQPHRRAHRSVQLLRRALRGALRRAALRGRHVRRAHDERRRRARVRAAAREGARAGLDAPRPAARPRDRSRRALPVDERRCSRRSRPIRRCARRRVGARRRGRRALVVAARSSRRARRGGRSSALCRGGARAARGRLGAGRRAVGRARTAIHARLRDDGQELRRAGVRGRGARCSTTTSARWTAMYRDACEATHVRGEQSAEVLDLRMACLQERLGERARAHRRLRERRRRASSRTPSRAAGALPRARRCADVAALRAVVKPPDDPATRQRVDALRAEPRARHRPCATRASARPPRRAVAPLVEAVARTTDTGRSSPTRSSSRALSAKFCGDPARRRRALKDAYAAAVAGAPRRRRGRGRGRACGLLSANRLGRPGGRARLGPHRAGGASSGLGRDDLLEGLVLSAEGMSSRRRGDSTAHGRQGARAPGHHGEGARAPIIRSRSRAS